MERSMLNPAARARLIKDMRTCEQTSGMTVLENGEMVADFFRDLASYVRLFGFPCGRIKP